MLIYISKTVGTNYLYKLELIQSDYLMLIPCDFGIP